MARVAESVTSDMLLLLLLPLALPAAGAAGAAPPGHRNASECVGGPCGPGREQASERLW